MKLILSDRSLALPSLDSTTQFIDLSQKKIKNCVGCFGCWTKTPGKCVIRDDATTIYPLIASSNRVIYISKIKYGSYDTIMKTILERSIPVQQAFIRLHHGESHHIQRNVVPKQAVIIGYGASSPEEETLFRQLISRNAYNMNFEHTQVHVVLEHLLEETLKSEVSKWKN
jgi:multimeric flavodoxin WrbA